MQIIANEGGIYFMIFLVIYTYTLLIGWRIRLSSIMVDIVVIGHLLLVCLWNLTILGFLLKYTQSIHLLNRSIWIVIWDRSLFLGEFKWYLLFYSQYRFHIFKIIHNNLNWGSLPLICLLPWVSMEIGLPTTLLAFWDIPSILFLELLKIVRIDITLYLRHIGRYLLPNPPPIDTKKEGMCLYLLHSINSQSLIGICYQPTN